MPTFGNRLRKIRALKGFSTKSLAAALDIDTSTLNRIENDQIQSLKPEFLAKISVLLETPLDKLIPQAFEPSSPEKKEGPLLLELLASKNKTIFLLEERIAKLDEKQ